MSPRRRSKKRPNRGRATPQPLEFWKAAPEMGPVEPISIPHDPTAVLRSLGNPPLTGQGESATRHLALAVNKAAQMATALAATTPLLDQDALDSSD